MWAGACGPGPCRGGGPAGGRGVGGGFVVIPALVFVLHLSMADAVGTSLVVIAANTAVALAARITGGAEIPWAIVLAFSAAGVVGAIMGNRVVDHASVGSLERAFAGMLLLMGFLTAARALGWI